MTEQLYRYVAPNEIVPEGALWEDFGSGSLVPVPMAYVGQLRLNKQAMLIPVNIPCAGEEVKAIRTRFAIGDKLYIRAVKAQSGGGSQILPRWVSAIKIHQTCPDHAEITYIFDRRYLEPDGSIIDTERREEQCYASEQELQERMLSPYAGAPGMPAVREKLPRTVQKIKSPPESLKTAFEPSGQ